MKNQLQDPQIHKVSCKKHNQKMTFVCVHKTCHHSFSVGCQKCRKDHGQHPNRLISLNDFHKMLSKPIHYMENSTAFKLMNLKKKIQYIRNFRTSILQKEVDLMESNQHIKNTIASILEQHYKIRDIVSHLDSEAIASNFQDYIVHLQKCKEFMAYNPVKANLVFNNQVIKSSRVVLEKHLKKSHDLTDSIRQLLVKIIEVLLANCAHEEDDDQIQFENEGDNPANFNIAIKIRTDVTQNPNIKSKLEHETFLQMFDEEKEALSQQIDILEKQLEIKATILNKIKTSSHIAKQKDSQSAEFEDPESEQRIQQVEYQSKGNKLSGQLRYTADSLFEKEKISNELLQMKEQYQTVIQCKEGYIKQLKETCQKLRNKIDELQDQKQQQSVRSKIVQQKEAMLDQYENANSLLKVRLEEMDGLTERHKRQLELKQKKIKALKQKVEELQLRQQSQQLNNSGIIQQQDQLLKERLQKLEEELIKKDIEITKQKKKYSDLERLVEKMKVNSEQSQKELLQWRDQHQQRQKVLRISLENSQQDIQQLHQKAKVQRERVKILEEQLMAKKSQIQAKYKQINNKQEQLLKREKSTKAQIQKLAEREESVKIQSEKLSKKEQEMKQQVKKITDRENRLKEEVKRLSEQKKQVDQLMRSSKKTESTIRPSEDESKKIKQMKQMLQISIKKNQELKNRNYELEKDLHHYKHQQAQAKNSQTQSNGRRALCEQNFSRNNTNFNGTPETRKVQLVKNQRIDPPSPTFKKRQSDLSQRNRKSRTPKGDKNQAYMQIKAIFKAVTEDMSILEDRLKQNTVIEKVYLKQLERKRTENKNLKKELQNIKLYGSHKHSEVHRAASPINRGAAKDRHEYKGSQQSPFNTKAVPKSQVK